MNRSVLILAELFLVSALSSLNPTAGQARTKEDKERENRVQAEIDAHKKAMSDQKKLQELEEKGIIIQKEAIDEALKDVQEHLGDVRRHKYIFKDLDPEHVMPFRWQSFENLEEPFIFTPDGDFFLGKMLGSNVEKSTWQLSKNIKEKSFSNEYTIDVDPTASTVVMSVNGDCRSGEIRIKISMPNGKTYSDIAIDEFGNLNWRKSFKISDEENRDKAGTWKFNVNAKKASGFFRISLLSY